MSSSLLNNRSIGSTRATGAPLGVKATETPGVEIPGVEDPETTGVDPVLRLGIRIIK